METIESSAAKYSGADPPRGLAFKAASSMSPERIVNPSMIKQQQKQLLLANAANSIPAKQPHHPANGSHMLGDDVIGTRVLGIEFGAPYKVTRPVKSSWKFPDSGQYFALRPRF